MLRGSNGYTKYTLRMALKYSSRLLLHVTLVAERGRSATRHPWGREFDPRWRQGGLFPNKETDDTKVCLDACGPGPNQCYRREQHLYPRSAEDGFGPDGGECYVEVTGILSIHYEWL